MSILLFCATVPRHALGNNDYDIILITIDTLRADHLSCYGYRRKTTPAIDRIAQKGFVFTNCIAPSSWTSPSIISLLTSVYPAHHGVTRGFTRHKKVYNQEIFSEVLTTLPQILQQKGYATFGAVSNTHLGEQYGFARGFNRYRCLPFLPAQKVNEIVASWKDDLQHARKYFLWVHYTDPHWGYMARQPWIGRYDPRHADLSNDIFRHRLPQLQKIRNLRRGMPLVDKLIARYDSEIAFTD